MAKDSLLPNFNAAQYEKIKVGEMIYEGSFGRIFQGIVKSKPHEEIIIKKVKIDEDHISREEEFAKSLKNPFIVTFLGTYISIENKENFPARKEPK